MNNETPFPAWYENSWIDKLTRTRPNSPLYFFIPVILAMLGLSYFYFRLPAIHIAGMFLLGVLTWTFTEYMLHRFLFHFEPKSAWGQKIIYVIHQVHHDRPNDADRLVIPLISSIPISTVVILGFLALLGIHGWPCGAGFLGGYLYYDYVHFSLHNRKEKFGWTNDQRTHHLRHHFQTADRRFGVSTSLWDRIFRTY